MILFDIYIEMRFEICKNWENIDTNNLENGFLGIEVHLQPGPNRTKIGDSRKLKHTFISKLQLVKVDALFAETRNQIWTPNTHKAWAAWVWFLVSAEYASALTSCDFAGLKDTNICLQTYTFYRHDFIGCTSPIF